MRAALLAVALSLPTSAYADDVGIPRDAYRYQRELIGHARAVWGLSAPVATFSAQIHQESMWREEAVSRTGAKGLGQFMPATSKWISGVYPELGSNEPANPSWGLRALVRYDRFLWERQAHHATDCDRMAFALADYNGGAGWRMKRQRMSQAPGAYAITAYINPGIHPMNQKENERYAPAILLRWQPRYLSWGIGTDCEGVL
jgi:soluble lytic murein transglycosylase-like protein